jgi:hypothetical protein
MVSVFRTRRSVASLALVFLTPMLTACSTDESAAGSAAARGGGTPVAEEQLEDDLETKAVPSEQQTNSSRMELTSRIKGT